MSDTKHTPGPWRIHKYSTDLIKDAERIVGADGSSVVMDVYGKTLENADANAQLIAAAPDLLEVAERLMNLDSFISMHVSFREPWENIIKVARAAIAKARGRL